MWLVASARDRLFINERGKRDFVHEFSRDVELECGNIVPRMLEKWSVDRIRRLKLQKTYLWTASNPRSSDHQIKRSMRRHGEDVGGSNDDGNNPVRSRRILAIYDHARRHALGCGERISGPHHFFCAGQICSESKLVRAPAHKSQCQNQRDGLQNSVAFLQFNHFPEPVPSKTHARDSRWSFFWAARAAWSI